MSKINIRSFSNENDDGAPDIVGVSTFSATSYFVPSKGTTAQRPSDHVEVGSLRYNTDIKNLEYYRGDTIGWSQFELIDPELGGGTGSNTGLGTRAVFAGGYTGPSPYPTGDTIDFITVSTFGDAQDFGNLANSGTVTHACASSTRGLFHTLNSRHIDDTNKIDFITFSSTGDAIDFGDLSLSRGGPGNGGCGSSTRGLFGSGITYSLPNSYFKNTIDYVTIAQTGNAVDFGDHSQTRGDIAALSSTTRGVFAGGYTPANVNTIDFVTISTLGNASDYGDLNNGRNRIATASNSTRGLYFGGQQPSLVNTIEFITIASTGNAVDFGDTTVAKRHATAASDPTRAVCAGGNNPSMDNIIESVTIATTGDALDFGDLTDERYSFGGASNGHGGL